MDKTHITQDINMVYYLALWYTYCRVLFLQGSRVGAVYEERSICYIEKDECVFVFLGHPFYHPCP